jgi:microcystin-dependent protein
LTGNIFSGFPPNAPLQQNSVQRTDIAAVKIGSLSSTFKNMMLSNNIIRLTAPNAGFSPYGFYLWQGVDMTTVQGNIVRGTSGIGIQVDSSVTDILVSDNLISSNLVNFVSPKAGSYLTFPSGLILPYAGGGLSTTPPDGWLFPCGQSLSTTDFPTLFAAIQYSYGGSAGTFYLPDLRGRVAVGRDNLGGTLSSPPRITTAGCGIDGTQLNSAGGVQLNTAVPSHVHAMGGAPLTSVSFNSNSTSGGSFVRCNGINGVSTTTSFGSSNTAVTGSATVSNVQPSIISNWIIKI